MKIFKDNLKYRIFLDTDVIDDNEAEEVEIKIPQSNIAGDKNPFRYDTSDDEEDKNTLSQKEIQQVNKTAGNEGINPSRTVAWVETFFFKDDDYRLQGKNCSFFLLLFSGKSFLVRNYKIGSRNFQDEKLYWFYKSFLFNISEGFDFIEKIKMVDNKEFAKSRRELKEIVKIKVRNVQQKKKPFKRKLGGSKRRKDIKMKKALRK